MKLTKTQIIDLVSIFLVILSISGAIIYRLANLKAFAVFFVLIFSAISALIIGKYFIKIKPRSDVNATIILEKASSKYAKISALILSILFIFFIVLAFFILFKFKTNESIISPWQAIPNYFFLLYFFAGSTLLLLILLKNKFNLLFIIIFSFFVNSIAIIIYRFGFGFDFFIHQATMDLIDLKGLVEPKPFYYLGQYSIIIVLHKLFFIPIFYLHLLLVPSLAAILIPINLQKVLPKYFNSEILISISLLFFAILPLGIFFNTTPQNLAFLFLLLVIIRGLDCQNYFDLIYIYLFSLAALLTQPIAGIPAVLLAIAVTVYNSDLKSLKNHLYRLLFVLSAISLPAAFILLNKLNKNTPNLDNSSIDNNVNILGGLLAKISIRVPNQESVVLNTIYFFENNLLAIFFIFIIFGLFIFYKQKKVHPVFVVYLYLATGLFVSYIITANLSFDFLIDYERLDYSTRIFSVSMMLFAPFLLLSLRAILLSLKNKNLAIKTICYFFLTLLIPIFLYINYPRFDNYHNSHGYSVGQDDIDATHWIEDDARTDYIVLANQQTAVAALHEFGFNRYYKTGDKQEIFYYPIPTGGPMYTYFLDMVNKKPERTTIVRAMRLVNVDIGYFVINKYWWASSKIIDEAKTEADSWHEINSGNIYIFKYTK